MLASQYSLVCRICWSLLLAFLMFFLGSEIFLRIYEDNQRSEVEENWSGWIHKKDVSVGYRPEGNVTVNHHFTSAGKTLFKVNYTTDAFQRRVVPSLHSAVFDKFLLFFGCSFVFGHGVDGTETLPAQTAQRVPHHVYNYGFEGYGPQHMLANLERNGIRSEVPEGKGLGVYLFIDAHVRRANQSLHWFSQYPETTPHYLIDQNGSLVRKASFNAAFPFTAALYRISLLTSLGRYLKETWDFPPYVDDKAIELTAKIIEQSRDEYRKKFGNDQFYVVIYPNSLYWERLAPYMKRANVSVLDYSGLFDGGEKQYVLGEGDSHPSALAYQKIATQLARDIQG